MSSDGLKEQDVAQIEEHGLSLESVQRQIELFRKPPSAIRILRPCTKGDGIRVIDEGEMNRLAAVCESGARKGRCIKFVPASGAASRMFRALLRCLDQGGAISQQAMMGRVQDGDETAQEVLTFIRGIGRFAFYGQLRKMAYQKGIAVDELLASGDLTPVIRLLVTDEGMDYAGLAKGLLLFHEYEDHNRTAFEEHLVEAVHYVADGSCRCRVHLTVSPEHQGLFRDLLERVRNGYEKRYPVSLDVTFSLQSPQTDTVAVDMANNPFREEDGRLVFRPAGHGALLENLNQLEGDIVFIKNIDNVMPDRLKGETCRWKKALGGYLMSFQQKVFTYVEALRAETWDRAVLDQAERFAHEELGIPVSFSPSTAGEEVRRASLLAALNRPIRVCGMVPNEGEPGGGPFWVEEPSGKVSIQIVERAQLDPGSREQQRIFESSTHFNPVDLVCGVRDVNGDPFDLSAYVDPDAIIITKKSKDGRDLKALEHPGLWNGAMARWITLLVEVPIITFNPVKTVNDLLRDAHQPG